MQSQESQDSQDSYSQKSAYSTHYHARGGSPTTKAARATFAKNTINNVIPHILQNNHRAMQGNLSTETIYYSPTILKIKAAKRGARKEGSKYEDDNDEEGEETTSVKSPRGESNLSPNPKAKITGFFKPLARVQKKKSEGDEDSGSVAMASPSKAGSSSDTSKISDPAALPSITSPKIKNAPAKTSPKISVIQSDTLNAAHTFIDPTAKNRRVAVLNMASFLRPGGGVVNGAIAQEESLCLRSTLYTSLDEKFYRLPKFGGLFTQDILVFRDSNNVDLPKSEWYFVDVISVAAIKNPDLVKLKGKETYEHEEDREEMISKIKLILLTALKKHTTHLILGALGCGAYYNPPEEVAKMFKRVIFGDKRGNGAMNLEGIEEIVFAIFDDGVNLRVFKEVLTPDGGVGGVVGGSGGVGGIVDAGVDGGVDEGQDGGGKGKGEDKERDVDMGGTD